MGRDGAKDRGRGKEARASASRSRAATKRVKLRGLPDNPSGFKKARRVGLVGGFQEAKLGAALHQGRGGAG